MKEGEELDRAAQTKKAPRPAAHPPRGETRTTAPDAPHLSPDDTREAAETRRGPPTTPWRNPDDALAARQSAAAVDGGQGQHVTKAAREDRGGGQREQQSTVVDGGDNS